jgi:hypothetical protein
MFIKNGVRTLADYRNFNLGLATKAKGCQGRGPRRMRMKTHTPK